MSKGGYLETCVESIDALRGQGIEKFELGALIGSGSQLTTRAQGCFPEVGFVALKLPKTEDSVDLYNRVYGDIAIIDFMLDPVPELKEAVPAFVGLVAVEGEDPVAIITEDASKNNELSVVSMSVSERYKVLLEISLEHEEADRFGGEVEDSVAFRVGGAERWLDFTPDPFDIDWLWNERAGRLLGRSAEATRDGSLTLTIPVDSPLARSIERS